MTQDAPGFPISFSEVDRAPVYCSAAWLFAIAVVPGAVAPGYVGAAAETLRLTDSRLGTLMALYFVGFGLAGASAYLWIRKVNWRITSTIGVTLMGGAFLAMASTAHYAVDLALMFIIGCGAGLFGSSSITVLGDMTRPERGFSVMIIFSVVAAAILLALFPTVAVAAGFIGINYLMAGSTLACLFLIPMLPRNNTALQRPVASLLDVAGGISHRGRLITQPMLAHCVMALFTLGFIGNWTFFERMAFYARLTPTATSNALAVGTLVGALGAPLAAYGRRRIPMHYCFGFVVGALVTTLVILSFAVLTNLSYLLLATSFQFWVNAGLCLIMALTAEVDKIGRFVALIPASEAFGAAVGPVVTGFALEHSGIPTMIAITVAAFLIGACVFTFVDRNDRASATRGRSDHK